MLVPVTHDRLRPVWILLACLVALASLWLDHLLDDGSLLLVANVFATPAWVMRKVAERLVNNCVFSGQVNRGLTAQSGPR